MASRWLNLFFRYSGFTYRLKQKIVAADSWLKAAPPAMILIISELGFAVVSLPMYLIVKPESLQEEGRVFPRKQKVSPHLQAYTVRRRISLATFGSAAGIFAAKILFIFAVSFYLLGAQALLAATQNWDFGTAGDYTYTAGKIAITGGVAQLVDQGGGGNCSGTATACGTFVTSPTCAAQGGCSWSNGGSGGTVNQGFNADAANWTYASWVHDTNGANSGNYQGAGGIPGGYVDINLSVRKNKTEAGYWRQATTTSVNSPDTAVLKFDWKSVSFGGALTTYKLYAFIDTGSGVPTIGTEVWSSPEITATTAWASSTVIDVRSKLPTAGTYYVKFGAYATRPNSGSNNLTYVSGFDNVSLTWSKAAVCSGTATACNTYTTSTTCSTQGGCAWNSVAVYPTSSPTIYPNVSLSPAGVTSWTSFTETASKGTGEIYYQLSSDDGATWEYWNGSIWATTTSATNYNTASDVNSHISAFSASAGRIKWKAFFASNGSQQITLDNLAIGYIQNDPPSIQSLSPSQNTASGYVQADYSLIDAQSDPSNLVNYEYSVDNTNWYTATAVPSDPAHSGISGLASSPSGITHAFVWDARNDLGNIYSNSVRFRLRANDGIASGNFSTSSSFAVDYVAPAITNVTAVQSSGSSNIQIGYDLFDNTASDILVELQVSADGGSTWTVPVSTVSGDIGASVASGNGKSIVWQAGTDYPNQEKNSMMARIRAKDKYQNQGSYVDSAIFVLDNRSPVIATVADLLAQPLAGATAVLVGGSFSESNPNTNDFYVAINGGGYGAAAAGDTDTATPSDKSVPAGVTLDGNDYASAVKIVHTDDFGHVTANENVSPNSAYKYVKPYTPPAPTISNPGESSLDVTINKHAAETSGLEYAIYESTQNKYVQADGTLGSSPYWQAIGTAAVTGLSQPISQYAFAVKSRNTSDSSHAASSESDLGSGASSDYQSPQIAINSAAQTTDGTKYVVINYTGTDYRNHANDLVKFEYSLNGADWQAMTEKSGVGSGGTTDLAFTSSGAALVFAWDVGADLPNVEDSTVYVRLQSNDSVTNSNLVVSPAFTVNTAGPVISNISVVQTSGTDNISITYDLADGAGANNTVVLSISDDSGATYAVAAPSKTGDVGAGVTAGLARQIIWNAGVDFSNQEKTSMKAKIVATDSYGNQGSPVESADFTADTKAPAVSAVAAAQGSGSALVAVNYTLSDLSSSDVEFGVSSNSGLSWAVATTTYTGDIGSDQTPGAKSFNWNAATDFPDQESDTMRVRVRARDAFGHQGAYQESADFSLNTKVLSISNITAVQDSGARIFTMHYDLNKDATISLNISSDGGATWNVATTTLSGQIGAGITAGHNKTVTWDAGADFNNQEKSNMRIRLRGVDSGGVISPYYESADFAVDTAAPLGLLSLIKFSSTDTSVTLNWSSGITDAHFNHYEIWHGDIQADVINRSGTAIKWWTANDANLSSIATISTVITGLSITADYYAKIFAVDDYGNVATAADVNIYTLPVVTPATPAAAETAPTGAVAIPVQPTVLAKPILSPLPSPTRLTRLAISGLATPRARIDLYDNGALVGRLNSTADNSGRFSQAFTLAVGQHVLTVRATDFDGNASPESDPITLNIVTTAPPAPIILSPRNNESITTANPVLIGVAEPLSTIEITLDNLTPVTVTADASGAWRFGLPADMSLADGPHTFGVRQVDEAGNASPIAVLAVSKAAPEAAVPGQPAISAPIAQPVPPVQLISETAQAVELAGIPVPSVTAAGTRTEVSGDILTFSGTSLPNSDVLVYVHSDQALIYRAHTDANGLWTVNHSQAALELAPGEHTIYAVAVDAQAQVKSRPSALATFTVKRNFWVMVFKYLNLQTTVVTLFILLLTILWLYRIRQAKGSVA